MRHLLILTALKDNDGFHIGTAPTLLQSWDVCQFFHTHIQKHKTADLVVNVFFFI